MAMLFVDPPWIGTGLGAELLSHARLSARQLGWPALRIEADPFAVPFYQHMGAVQIGVVGHSRSPTGHFPCFVCR
jgi:GNAT superfamily N-acetyltransferase